MAQYKGIIFFSGGFSGWTERYFLLASSSAGAASNLLAVLTARKACLHNACGIGPAYISDVAIRGDSITVVGTTEEGGAADITGYMDVDVAALIKWQVGVFNRNKTFFRGIPLAQTVDGTFVPIEAYLTAFNAWQAAVLANCVMPITERNLTPPPNYTTVSYAPILSSFVALGLARRKSGRPFGLPRGRRVAP